VNRKVKVDKRYVSPDVSHQTNWERLPEFKVGRRMLKRGQVVKIHGQRGAHFEFLYGERNIETGAVALTFVGGAHGHRLTRSFKPEKVGAFLYMAIG
jgi:hypothetical protein